MSLLMFSYRVQSLIARKEKLNFDIMQLSQKLMEMQSYASSIADGCVSMNDLLNSPGNMLGRMSIFMQASHQASYAFATQNMGPMMAMNQMNMAQVPPQMQAQYQQYIFKSLYEQERQKFADGEKRLMDREETKIRMSLAQKQDEAQMVEAELKSTKESLSQEAKDSAPKYA